MASTTRVQTELDRHAEEMLRRVTGQLDGRLRELSDAQRRVAYLTDQVQRLQADQQAWAERVNR